MKFTRGQNNSSMVAKSEFFLLFIIIGVLKRKKKKSAVSRICIEAYGISTYRCQFTRNFDDTHCKMGNGVRKNLFQGKDDLIICNSQAM